MQYAQSESSRSMLMMTPLRRGEREAAVGVVESAGGTSVDWCACRYPAAGSRAPTFLDDRHQNPCKVVVACEEEASRQIASILDPHAVESPLSACVHWAASDVGKRVMNPAHCEVHLGSNQTLQGI